MKKYQEFEGMMKTIADIQYAAGVLQWDNEVFLPAKGMRYRSQQLATLMGMAHEKFTSKKMGKILEELSSSSLKPKQRRNVLLAREAYDRDKKFTSAFIQQKSMAISHAYQAWVQAKQNKDFSLFEKPLDVLFDMVRREADIIGYDGHPYNALVHLYERGMTVATLDKVFGQVKSELLPFIQMVRTKKQADVSFLHQLFPKDQQWQFGLDVLKNMGYDFEAGRQDLSPHPFTISFNPLDVRVTTRVDEHDFSNMTWSCIHEGGHALYEQGLNAEDYGMPVGSAASLAIHESQSRLWENNVGRSKAFWKYQLPFLKKKFSDQLKGVSLEQFYKAINVVKPNLIRTEADELHYHLHVLIRYEIEKEIVSSTIKAAEVKQLWNEKYRDYLGMIVNNDAEGILQDVHWSHGSIGYFPTYSLGSFYAAQFYQKASADLPDLQQDIEKGKMDDLLAWLRKNIHSHGAMYDAEILCKKVTGEKLNLKHFMHYVQSKY